MMELHLRYRTSGSHASRYLRLLWLTRSRQSKRKDACSK